MPSPSLDLSVSNGFDVPIEQRAAAEVETVTGRAPDGSIATVRVLPEGSAVANYGFDVTPARLVTGLITERGIVEATRAALAKAFPERVPGAPNRTAAE
jgi:methylthioribose-1-phosphate isomerase